MIVTWRAKHYGVEIRPLLVATIHRLPHRTIDSTRPTPGTVSPRFTRQMPFGPSKTAVPSMTSRSIQPPMVVGLVSGNGVGFARECRDDDDVFDLVFCSTPCFVGISEYLCSCWTLDFSEALRVAAISGAIGSCWTSSGGVAAAAGAGGSFPADRSTGKTQRLTISFVSLPW